MAPRKSKAKAPATTSPVQSGKVAKPKSKATKGKAKSNAAPAVSPASTHGVKLYRDGLVNLEKTPAHLVDIVKQNAVNSPLLRLPRELRDQIWSFAMGGQFVYLPTRSEKTAGRAILPESENCKCISQCRYGSDYETCKCVLQCRRYGSRPGRCKVPAAFHLPEVCRQIYSESALTAYQQSVFLVHRNFYHYGSFHRFTRAQRKAITGISIEDASLLTTTPNTGEVERIISVLPNLSYIRVPGEAVCACERDWFMRDDGWIKDTEEWHTNVLRELDSLFGGKVRIEIEK